MTNVQEKLKMICLMRNSFKRGSGSRERVAISSQASVHFHSPSHSRKHLRRSESCYWKLFSSKKGASEFGRVILDGEAG